jgi:Ca2+-binding EF-hand superfamily protein
MTRARLSTLAAAWTLACAPAFAADPPAPAAPSASPNRDAVQDVVFLGEARPLFLRLNLGTGTKGFRSSWIEAVKSIHAYLDQNGDGTLTREEADRGGLPTMVRAATGGAAALPRADLDTSPKDGKVSLEELADVLRPALGPFRAQQGGIAVERADALFNHIDRDKDGALTKDELAAAVSSLRRFDLDDDELIDPAELEPFSNPMAAQMDDPSRRGRVQPVPTVLELSPDDASIRPVRLLLKRYDVGTPSGSTAGDNRLDRDEFKIDAKDFQAADTDADGALDTEELRRYLAHVKPDLEMSVQLPDDGSAPASIKVAGLGDKPLPPGVKVQTLAGGDVEISIGDLNLEFHADAGEKSVENAKRYYSGQFQAADKDNNKYLEKSEVNNSHGPFGVLFDVIDRDGDGKVYMKEVDDFVARQAEAARSQIVLTTADQGRAIFAIMDLNRDRHLGAREILGTVPRVLSWDRNGDGRVKSDEIPHHYQLTIGRGQVTPVGAPAFLNAGMSATADNAPGAGPSWFRRMDRNRDGDISRREFLGPRADFERMDADRDGLISPTEAVKPKG